MGTLPQSSVRWSGAGIDNRDVGGLKKPPERQKITDDERKARDRKHDKNKRQGKHDTKQEDSFRWLKFDDQAQPHMMYCRPCSYTVTYSELNVSFSD